MGMDITIWAGYGFGGSLEDEAEKPAIIEDAIRRQAESDGEQQAFEILDARFAGLGLRGLSISIGGDSWGGPERWSVTANGTHMSMDARNPEAPQTAAEPTAKERALLERAREILGWPESPSWMMQADIM